MVSGEERLIPEESIVRMRSDYYEVRGWGRAGKTSSSLLRALKIDFGKK